MFENVNENGFMADGLDLGSMPGDFGEFTVLDNDEAETVFGDFHATEDLDAPKGDAEVQVQKKSESGAVQPSDEISVNTEVTESEENKDETAAKVSAETASEHIQAESNSETTQDLWSAVMAEADEKQAEVKKNSLIKKL